MTPAKSSGIGFIGLLRRQRRHSRSASLLVSALVLAAATLLAVAPSAFTAMSAKELDQTIRHAAPTARYLVATSPTPPDPGSSASPSDSDLAPEFDQEYGALADQLEEAGTSFPEPLRGMVGTPRWSITTSTFSLDEQVEDSDPPGAIEQLVMRVDPYAAESVDIVEGDWPSRTAPVKPRSPIGVVLSEESARQLGWTVGETRTGFRLTGIFRAKDSAGDYWALNPSMLQANVFDDGNGKAKVTVTAYADPLRYLERFTGPLTLLMKIWYPLDLGSMTGGQVEQVIRQLRRVTATTYTSPTGNNAVDSLSFATPGVAELQTARDRTVAARAVLTLAAIGPVGAALVVLSLAIGSLATRRRTTVGLLASRGASPWHLRAMLVIDGLLVGVLPAVLAIGLTWVVFRTDLAPAGVVLAGLAGLLPAAILASVRIAAAMRPARADSGVRSQSRYRWAVEALLVGLAAVSVYVLTTAGLRADQNGGRVDLLVAAAPVLLAGAACVVVLRLYPVPLRLLARTFRRGRSGIAFLGSVRALRDPVVGVAPVLAVLAGVSVAVFSAVTLTTIDDGTHAAALQQVGADLRLEGPVATDDVISRIRDVAGVAAAARVHHAESKTIGFEGSRPTVTDVYLADLGELRQVQAGMRGAAELAAGAGTKDVVVSSSLANSGGTVSWAGGSADILASADQVVGVTRGEDRWVLADGSNEEFGSFVAQTVLIRLTPDADVTEVRHAITDITGPDRALSDVHEIEAGLRDDATATGLRVALLAAISAAGIAAAATVVLTLLLGARARARMLAILRVLGFSHRQRRWLAVWEQAPVAAGALVVGGVLGLGVAVLVHGVVDLSSFTGGTSQPALAVAWLEVLGLVAGFLLLMTVAIALGLVATRRTSAAAAVRLDEE